MALRGKGEMALRGKGEMAWDGGKARVRVR
jgi:hypothetical protein